MKCELTALDEMLQGYNEGLHVMNVRNAGDMVVNTARRRRRRMVMMMVRRRVPLRIVLPFALMVMMVSDIIPDCFRRMRRRRMMGQQVCV